MTLKELYLYGKKNLPEEVESLILCEEFYGMNRTDIIMKPNFELDEARFFDAIKRRTNGEPLQYILGFWTFDDMNLTVKNGVLIPREDTMVAVNCAVDFIGNNNFHGLDLCSGTGAIALSIAKNCKNSSIEALELYPIPLECLAENIKKYGNGQVSFKKADVFEEYKNYSELDFIVSNPPYIEKKDIKTLQTEVQNEPHTALDGGEDGLDFYRIICNNWSKCLKNNGFLSVEIGETQGQDVKKLFLTNNFKNVEILKDFNGLDRAVCGKKCI